MDSGTRYTSQFGELYDRCPLCGASSIDISHARNLDGLGVSWFRCAVCSLVFQNPPMTAAAMRNEYAKRNYRCAAYGDYIRDDPIRLRQARKRLHLIERFSIPGVRLLDVGSASGFFGAVARERGYHVTCIEPDQEMASHGRETYNLDIRAVTLEEWELEPSNFDIVTLWGTDSHFSHPLEGFAKIAQALRPNGLLAMSYQDFDHWIRRIFPEIKVGWNVIFNLTDRSFDVLLERVGLELVYRRKTEWQLTTIGHILRMVRIAAPSTLGSFSLRVPAISFRLIVARKR